MLKKTVKYQKFIETLRADLKVELLKFGPNNFEDAVKRAKHIELAHDDFSQSVNNVNNVNTHERDSSNDILQRLDKMEEQFSQIYQTLTNLTEQKIS